MLTAADVRGKRFTATKFREGYNQREVDAFLERATMALDSADPSGAMTVDQVVQVRFNPTKLSPGYDQAEVDDFLDAIVSALEAASGSAASATASPGLGSRGAGGEVPQVLQVLRVADYALFAVAVALLLLDLAPAPIVFGMLVVSALGGTAVQFLIFRAEKKYR